MIRIFDILFSSFSLVLFLPLLLAVILILKITGEGEVFYLQERVGKDKKIFKLFKFATMIKDSPNIGTKTLTIKDDPRILPMGHFLRKYKINELPQLLNVFIGQMSLIGPRPLTLDTFEQYSEKQKSILRSLSPGLSGVGSIYFRNEEDFLTDKNMSEEFYKNYILPYKAELEIWFFYNKSIRTYFILIFITVFAIFTNKINFLELFFKNLPTPSSELKKLINNT